MTDHFSNSGHLELPIGNEMILLLKRERLRFLTSGKEIPGFDDLIYRGSIQ